jgi:hypothetical protein
MKRLLLALLLACVVGCVSPVVEPDPLFHMGQMVKLRVDGRQGQIIHVFQLLHPPGAYLYEIRIGTQSWTAEGFELEEIE